MHGVYDHRLVALSVFIAIFAAYAALELAARTTAARGRARLLWLAGGASAMGLGIWSMHYIGMLAFSLPVTVEYDWPTVLLSLVAAVFASAVALFVVSRSKMVRSQALIGSAIMGGGISIMHYTGMAGMRLRAMCSYDPALVSLSILLAVAISLIALWLTFQFRDEVGGSAWLKSGSAVLMGAAIAIMHYTGMAAASFTPMNIVPDTSHSVGTSTLGFAGVTAVTLLVLAVTVFTSTVDRRFAAQRSLLDATRKIEKSLRNDLDALTRMHALSGKRLGVAGLEPLLQEVIDVGIAILGAKKGMLQIAEGTALHIVAHHAHERPFLEFFAEAESIASACGEATKLGERVCIEDVEQSSLLAGTPSLLILRQADVRAVQSTPLIARTGKFLGVLTTHWNIPHVPDEHDLWRLDLIARQAADMIESAQADQSLRKIYEDMEDRVRSRTGELDDANRNLRDLSARLLQLQDEERRRIARELHDSMGQLLAALSMILSPLTQNGRLVDVTSRKAIEESLNIIRELTKEVRTMSHLLHPPLLDEAGLSSAVRWYIEGFAERSKIKVELEMPEDFGRLPREMETTVFRIVQECLTNIHRHSGSAVARVSISQSESEIQVAIRDQGKGISPAKRAQLDIPGKAGVGVRGMRERLRQLGGTLEVYSPADGRGTIFSAHVPFRHACTATA